MKAQQLNHKKTTPPQLTPLEQCKDGDVIPSSNDCNTCYCIDNRIMCTLIECFDPISDIEGGFNEEDEYSDLQVYHNQLPVEPSVDVITRNHGKEPARLVYTHTHNDFPVETNVYPGQLSKDTSTLLKALSSRLHDRYYNAPPFDLNTARPNWQTSFHQIQSNPKVGKRADGLPDGFFFGIGLENPHGDPPPSKKGKGYCQTLTNYVMADRVEKRRINEASTNSQAAKHRTSWRRIAREAVAQDSTDA
ncbi:unnamed protein product [Spodoptera exigua]|nr:unnamed protein product [Spodoptera exigua]